eukprot:27191_1
MTHVHSIISRGALLQGNKAAVERLKSTSVSKVRVVSSCRLCSHFLKNSLRFLVCRRGLRLLECRRVSNTCRVVVSAIHIRLHTVFYTAFKNS